MTTNEKKNKHLTLDDRIEIQECLTKGMTYKAIGKRIGKDPTTISKEVKKHTVEHKNGYFRLEGLCPCLKKAPFVCNGCDKKSKSSCPYTRYLYEARKADIQYRDLLVESRTGIPLNKESFYEVDHVLTRAIKQGQHIYHALQTNHLPVSKATVYRHMHKGYYSFGPMDLPRVVKFKIRNHHKKESIPHWVRKGRTYQDYLEYLELHPNENIVQLDTVIGRVGGKTIMTLHFVSCDFMVGLLLENKTAVEAANKIKELKQHLTNLHYSFGNIVPVLLTDNGGEFSLVSDFENNLVGEQETRLFFCEPSSPHEKPDIEKNHTLFRDIMPKGSSFDDLTQEDVNLIFSHVNAVKRKQFNGKSAYDLFVFYYSHELAKALGISFVAASDVIQSPRLLKHI